MDAVMRQLSMQRYDDEHDRRQVRVGRCAVGSIISPRWVGIQSWTTVEHFHTYLPTTPLNFDRRKTLALKGTRLAIIGKRQTWRQ